ncbi:MAG: transposase [Chitinophagaceae bacterium]
MLTQDKVISLYCIIDDILKAMRHRQDIRIKVTDSEVLTTAFVAGLYFGGHHDNARMFMKYRGLIPAMLDKSQFCRRLHRLSELLWAMFYQVGSKLKELAGAADYVIDSFPLAVSDNMRIKTCRLLKGRQWLGKCASMRRYFHGVKVQVLTLKGIPVEFSIVPGSENDTKALTSMDLEVAPESTLYCDAGYTNYVFEDMMEEMAGVKVRTARKSNSKRPDKPWRRS